MLAVGGTNLTLDAGNAVASTGPWNDTIHPPTRARATPIVCSKGVQGCSGSGQSIAFVGGTSAAAPLVAGMIALWNQQARNQGLPKPGFVPPLLYATAKRNPEAFLDVTGGTNALFGGSCCPARPGFDLATGWGSPMANTVAGLLAARG